jgi:glycosyltransferase involved in cell wall biosynthesis
VKVAAFARGLTRSPTGRGMLAREMILALRRLQPDIEIHLFSAENPDWPGVHWKPALGAGLFGESWRLLSGIARDVAAIRPEIFWSATHILPYGLPTALPKVATLLDLVWRDHPETMSAKNRRVAEWFEPGLHRVDRIACISAFTRDRLIAHWPELANRAVVVHLGGGPTMAGSIATLSSRPYVVNVDTLEPRKNLPVLLDAFADLPDIDFVHCGGIGWGVDEVVRRASGMPSVKLRGYVPDSELRSLYRGALAAAFPSIYEGFHLPPLDAVSVGCPVIASDIPVHREVLGEAAVFVAPHDSRAWAAAISSLRDDPARRAHLAEAGRQRAQRFTWEASARALLQVFQSVA